MPTAPQNILTILATSLWPENEAESFRHTLLQIFWEIVLNFKVIFESIKVQMTLFKVLGLGMDGLKLFHGPRKPNVSRDMDELKSTNKAINCSSEHDFIYHVQ